MYDSISKCSVIILYISKPIREKNNTKAELCFLRPAIYHLINYSLESTLYHTK